MSQVLVELSDNSVTPETVSKVTEIVKTVHPEITPSKVESISAMVESLSTEVTAKAMELVTSMSHKMGPVLSHRETQMISRMAGSWHQAGIQRDVHSKPSTSKQPLTLGYLSNKILSLRVPSMRANFAERSLKDKMTM